MIHKIQQNIIHTSFFSSFGKTECNITIRDKNGYQKIKVDISSIRNLIMRNIQDLNFEYIPPKDRRCLPKIKFLA